MEILSRITLSSPLSIIKNFLLRTTTKQWGVPDLEITENYSKIILVNSPKYMGLRTTEWEKFAYL